MPAYRVTLATLGTLGTLAGALGTLRGRTATFSIAAGEPIASGNPPEDTEAG